MYAEIVRFSAPPLNHLFDSSCIFPSSFFSFFFTFLLFFSLFLFFFSFPFFSLGHSV